MLRRFFLMALVTSAALLSTQGSVDAAPVSLKNPYRSFNITGVNYGSTRWEAQHRGRAMRTYHGGGLFHFRRR
jgi:hypothetical protein